FESRLFREKHTCHGPCDTVSDNRLSDHRDGHCVISIDDDYNDERFPTKCIPAPRRIFTQDNPECDGSLPEPLFINFSQPLPPPAKLFQCDTCFRSFLNLDTLSSHIACNHLLPDYNCFRRSNTVKRKSFASCHLCGALFGSKSLFNHHPCISAPQEEESSPLQNSSQPPLSYPNFSLAVDFPPTLDQVTPSYPNFSLGVSFPPTPVNAPVPVSSQNSSISNQSQAPPTVQVNSTKNDSALPVDHTSIRNSSHTIPVIGVPAGDASPQDINPPSSGPSAPTPKSKKVAINSSQPSQDVSPDDPPPSSDIVKASADSRITNNDTTSFSLASLPCPPHSRRISDVVDFLFPLSNPMKCTEPGCTFDSVSGTTWNQIKCSLLRHLKATHCFTKLKSRHWCATCGRRIKVPKKHACLALGTTIDTECEHKCQHPDCSFSSPTVLGLRNHTAAHRKSDALAATVQRKILNSIKTNKRTKKLKKQVSDIPDEAISDPSVSLAAPHVTPGDVPAPPAAPPQPEPGPLSIYIQALEAILQQDPSDEVFVHLCETVEQAVSEVQKISLPDDFGNPAPQEPRKQRKPLSVKDAQSAQLLYCRNPKRAVREICEGEPIRCQIPTETIEDFFYPSMEFSPTINSSIRGQQ
ncbi:hypothetical protein AVEN_107580-1, partial [Araneus ventricosus]